ncbi:MAG: carbohydrate ABC transporter permease [Chthonomonas sp.]|nr:carbohydrate ABC transporter permease [Chthonomonas sp.]
MNPGLFYVLGTLATWFGFVLVFLAIAHLMRMVFRPIGYSPETAQRGVIMNGVVGGALLLVSQVVQLPLGREAPSGIHLPIAWVLMPWSGWLALVSVFFIIARLVQSTTAITAAERSKKLTAAGLWLVAGVIGVWQFSKSGEQATYFRGAIPMSASFVACSIGLAIAAAAAMAWTSKRTATRGITKNVLTVAALVVGSIIFGIPFAWLLLSSFKEDKDIAQADALRWQPLVTRQMDYMDPKSPLFETKIDGQTVQAAIMETVAPGRVKIDINKPMAMRGQTSIVDRSSLKEIPKQVPMVTSTVQGTPVTGFVTEEFEDGRRRMQITSPASMKGQELVGVASEIKDVREPGLRWQNYPDALDFLPPDTAKGLLYLKNTLILVVLTVLGVLVSSTMVAYAFARLRFYGKNFLFGVMLSTMMLPGAVTMLPQFLIYRSIGWIDTLYPLWVPAFFAGAFNVFLLRQFIAQIPMELEDAAKVDGCTYLTTLWQIMVPQIKPALAAISVMTTLGTWNNFMGPLIYISSPDRMPIAYGLQLYSSSRGGEPALLMAATTMSVLPVILLFFFAQKYLIEGVTLSGLGGR